MGAPMGILDQGRELFARRAWADSYAQLAAADRESPLGPEDLLRMALAAFLVGRDADSVEILARAHHGFANSGAIELAVRCTFWLGFQLMFKGEDAQAGGWFARGRRLLDEGGLDCVERGYMLVPDALQSLFAGDFPRAYSLHDQVATIAHRFGDSDLRAIADLGRGKSLIRMGRPQEGVTLLDEVMVDVTAGEVSPAIAGIVYCAVIATCHEVFDLRRAREWTDALTRWCASQPDLVPYRGACLVHRAQIMRVHGAWPDAVGEAERARKHLTEAKDPAVGYAFYELGEIHRVRGDFEQSEAAYRQASQWGHAPQPGLAQLRLAQGQLEAADAAIRRVVEETSGPMERATMLGPFVEIVLAAGDVAAARTAADELSTIAASLDAPFLDALAGYARGAVLLADGDTQGALGNLRKAWTIWRSLDAPYEAARTRALMGLACRRLGDSDTAEMELDAARWGFEQLGAAADLARVEELLMPAAPAPAEGLTGREIEVLALIATGKTNREIGAELVISEKTVARHVSNIFTKLGVTSRAAATAFAYKHELV